MTEGFVLAGGHGRRMGTDKAHVDFLGRPMALAVADALAPLCSRVRIVRREAEAPGTWPLGVVLDGSEDSRHPLFGIAAALRACETELARFAPCDVPFLTTEALERLTGPSVAHAAGHIHPLICVLPAQWSERALNLALRGGSAKSLVADLVRVELPAHALSDLNRPEDLPR